MSPCAASPGQRVDDAKQTALTGNQASFLPQFPGSRHRWILSTDSAPGKMQDTTLLEIEVVLDQDNLADAIDGNHTHAVLNDDVLVCASDAVGSSLGKALKGQRIVGGCACAAPTRTSAGGPAASETGPGQQARRKAAVPMTQAPNLSRTGMRTASWAWGSSHASGTTEPSPVQPLTFQSRGEVGRT